MLLDPPLIRWLDTQRGRVCFQAVCISLSKVGGVVLRCDLSSCARMNKT
jgi:hypothetical protein